MYVGWLIKVTLSTAQLEVVGIAVLKAKTMLVLLLLVVVLLLANVQSGRMLGCITLQ